MSIRIVKTPYVKAYYVNTLCQDAMC